MFFIYIYFWLTAYIKNSGLYLKNNFYGYLLMPSSNISQYVVVRSRCSGTVSFAPHKLVQIILLHNDKLNFLVKNVYIVNIK